MAKYYLSILYKDKRGEVTDEHKKICSQSSNFLCEKNTNRIYYDIKLDSILKENAHDLKYIAYFTMNFNNSEQFKQYLVVNGLMPVSLLDKRINIYTTYKNERFGLETGIPYANTKDYFNPQTIKKYYLNNFDNNKDAYFQSKFLRDISPRAVDYMLLSRLYRILESRYSRPSYLGTNKALENVYILNDIMKKRRGRIGHLTQSVRKDLIKVLDRELYLQSDSKKGINYHGLIVLANSISIHKKWQYNENMKAYDRLIDEAPPLTDSDAPKIIDVEDKPIQLNFFDKMQK